MGLHFWLAARGGQTTARKGQERVAYPHSLSQSAAERSRRPVAQVQKGDGRGDEPGATAEIGARRLSDRRDWMQQDPGPSVQGKRTDQPDHARTGGLSVNGYRADSQGFRYRPGSALVSRMRRLRDPGAGAEDY